jgi:hypothetical protein
MLTYPPLYGTLPIGAVPAYVAPAAASMARIAVLSPIDSDAATIAAGSEVSSLPAANLQSQQPKKVWRSSSTADYVTLSCAAPVAANMLAVSGHNFSAAGLFRVRGANSPADTTAAPSVDTGWQSVWPVTGKPADAYWPRYLSALLWSNDALYQCWRIDFADPSVTLTYLEAGRLALGRYWQPTINFDLGGTPLGRDQRDVQTVTDYGELFTDRRQRSAARRMSLQISGADKREVLDGIQEIQRLAGMAGDVFVLLDPNATTDFHRHSMQGVFTAQQDHQIVPQFTDAGEMWTVNFPLREVI